MLAGKILFNLSQAFYIIDTILDIFKFLAFPFFFPDGITQLALNSGQSFCPSVLSAMMTDVSQDA